MTPRRPTYPLSRSSRQKPRRWPLVLRFYKGAVHGQILAPVLFHSLFTVLVVYLDMYVVTSLGLPSTMIPSLSIVVGLMLVFRNQTSYDRFWTGRNCFTTCGTTVRNLSRSFLVSARGKEGKELSDVEKQDTERTVKMLVASLYAIKHCLREEWNLTPSDALAERLRSPPSSQMRRSDSGFWGSLSQSLTQSITSRPPSRAPGPLSGFATPTTPHFPTYETILNEYSVLLPPNMESFEDQGLALPLQLATSVEGFVRRGFERGWFHGPQASQMTVQLNTLTEGYGKMETIRTTPLPVAHLYVTLHFCSGAPRALLTSHPFSGFTRNRCLLFTSRCCPSPPSMSSAGGPYPSLRSLHLRYTESRVLEVSSRIHSATTRTISRWMRYVRTLDRRCSRWWKNGSMVGECSLEGGCSCIDFT